MQTYIVETDGGATRNAVQVEYLSDLFEMFPNCDRHEYLGHIDLRDKETNDLIAVIKFH